MSILPGIKSETGSPRNQRSASAVELSSKKAADSVSSPSHRTSRRATVGSPTHLKSTLLSLKKPLEEQQDGGLFPLPASPKASPKTARVGKEKMGGNTFGIPPMKQNDSIAFPSLSLDASALAPSFIADHSLVVDTANLSVSSQGELGQTAEEMHELERTKRDLLEKTEREKLSNTDYLTLCAQMETDAVDKAAKRRKSRQGFNAMGSFSSGASPSTGSHSPKPPSSANQSFRAPRLSLPAASPATARLSRSKEVSAPSATERRRSTSAVKRPSDLKVSKKTVVSVESPKKKESNLPSFTDESDETKEDKAARYLAACEAAYTQEYKEVSDRNQRKLSRRRNSQVGRDIASLSSQGACQRREM